MIIIKISRSFFHVSQVVCRYNSIPARQIQKISRYKKYPLEKEVLLLVKKWDFKYSHMRFAQKELQTNIF